MLALEGFLFGLTIAAAIGPIALLIMNYGIRFGPWAGLRSGAGAASADFLYALAALFAGVAITAAIGPRRVVFEVAAAGILIAYAVFMWTAAWKSTGEARSKPARPRPYLTTLGLTVFNPLTVIVFLGFAGGAPSHVSIGELLLTAAMVALGSLLVQSIIALGGAGLGRLLASPAWLRRLNLASAAGIAAFGLWGLFKALR